MSIWAHTLVKNEDKYLWFTVTSVVDYVDRILLWDTGSTDDTIKVAKELKRRYLERIDFRQVVQKDIYDFTLTRQKMLDQTQADWLMILDGDEVWWEEGIKETIKSLNSNLETVVTPHYNVVGDVFYYQEETAGMYKIDNRRGHFNIRFISLKIPGLHFEKPHGTQGLFDKDGILIQNRDKAKRIFIDKKCYLHFTNVPRSTGRDVFVSKRKMKIKYEIGNNFPKDFYYPEAFFKPAPSDITSPWSKMSSDFAKKAMFQTPLRKIKRRLFRSDVGY